MTRYPRQSRRGHNSICVDVFQVRNLPPISMRGGNFHFISLPIGLGFGGPEEQAASPRLAKTFNKKNGQITSDPYLSDQRNPYLPRLTVYDLSDFNLCQAGQRPFSRNGFVLVSAVLSDWADNGTSEHLNLA